MQAIPTKEELRAFLEATKRMREELEEQANVLRPHDFTTFNESYLRMKFALDGWLVFLEGALEDCL